MYHTLPSGFGGLGIGIGKGGSVASSTGLEAQGIAGFTAG